MQTFDNSVENFKTSPLGFLMSVLAKYEAYLKKAYEKSSDNEDLKKSKLCGSLLDDLKIELSKTELMKKEISNEAVLMHAVESFSKENQQQLLDCIFEYLGLLDNVIETLDKDSQTGKEALTEYYDVSRLGVVLNCYLGEFENDDFFYGTLAEIAETVYSAKKNSGEEKILNLCNSIIEKIQKADISLSFRKFIQELYESADEESKKIIYEQLIKTYAESLLNKVLTQPVSSEEISKFSCAKQIQRIYEKIMIN